ncbi:hypothetical protein T484DRAFT_1830917 [Baffinella frigidus]|nr:hypothetical protein T484DRAFT_1830917 [Cryptophyta sp. CCMP2293]
MHNMERRKSVSPPQRVWDATISESEDEDAEPPTPVPGMQGAACLPGSSDQEETMAASPSSEADLEEYLHDDPSQPAALPGRSPPFRVTSLRGAALALRVAHPSTGETRDDLSLAVLPLSDNFRLRGELIHVFVSYRVNTEGPSGNRLSGRISERIRALSMDSRQELQIPQHGWGLWPESVKKPVPFRQEEAKVFVPLLSWTEDDRGSVGELSRIGAVLPVLIGPAHFSEDGGGFKTLSHEPSMATNARAGAILRQLGLSEDKVEAVMGQSVKQVVDEVLRNQGVQASEWGDVDGVQVECGTRVLRTVLQEIRRLRSDPKYFEVGTPMGSEESNLRSYAPLFVHHNLDSLEHVARLTSEELRKLFDEHEEIYSRSGRKGEMGGGCKKLAKAHGKLLQKTPSRLRGLIRSKPDERTLPLSERLDGYQDTEASAMAMATSGNGLELMHTKPVVRWCWLMVWVVFGGALYSDSVVGLDFWGKTLAMKISLFVVTAGVGLLPLVTPTARMFVEALQMYVTFYFLFFSAQLFIEWAETGNGFLFWYWIPFFSACVFLVQFRKKYFLVGYLIIIFAGFGIQVPLMCATGSISYAYDSYTDCVVRGYYQMAIIYLAIGSLILLLIVRKIANTVLAWQAATTSQDDHRHASLALNPEP